MNEVGPASLQGLAMGLDALPAAERDKVEVIAGTAGAQAAVAAGADVVIADPPRKGLDAELMTQLANEPPPRFLYVSCGLDSLLTDTQKLTANGRLRLRELSAFNLMPYTGHVETVACFERA
jgi:tRNA/tmRNA/rRNA uracil-C5-methylase (TrmA/RlmC/RlmD family)